MVSTATDDDAKQVRSKSTDNTDSCNIVGLGVLYVLFLSWRKAVKLFKLHRQVWGASVVTHTINKQRFYLDIKRYAFAYILQIQLNAHSPSALLIPLAFSTGQYVSV